MREVIGLDSNSSLGPGGPTQRLLFSLILCSFIHFQLNVLFPGARFQGFDVPSWYWSVFPNYGNLGTPTYTLRILAVEVRRGEKG